MLWQRLTSRRSPKRHSAKNRRSKPCRRRLLHEPLEGRWMLSATTYDVTNLDDSGPGSLRQAIIDANSNR